MLPLLVMLMVCTLANLTCQVVLHACFLGLTKSLVSHAKHQNKHSKRGLLVLIILVVVVFTPTNTKENNPTVGFDGYV